MNIIKNRISAVLVCFYVLSSSIMANNSGSASVGSVTIDGKIYNQISFRPEFSMKKIKLGLDLYFYLDDEGGFYEKPWDFSNGEKALENILDKILYLQYGNLSDPLFYRFGSMPSTTLGYGIIVNQYSNTVQYPNVRRLGFRLKHNGSIGSEIIVSDIKRSPGLVASRMTFPVFKNRFNIGVFAAADFNMTKGLMDSDDDGYPDYFDDFPNDGAKNNKEWEDYLSNPDWYVENVIGVAECDTEQCVEQILQDAPGYNSYDSESFSEDNIYAIGFDASWTISKKWTIYSQFAQLSGEKINNESLGYGFVPIAISGKGGSRNFKWSISAEARSNSRHFMYSFWDQTYDLNRAQVVIVDGEQQIETKRQQLEKFGELKGYYFNTNLSMFDLIDFDLSYQDMQGETWDGVQFNENKRSKSLLGSLSFDTSRIPVLHLAKIYYQRNNDTNFDFSTPSLNTIHGYDLGVELSSGVVLVYKGKTTYISDPNTGELKPNFTLQVETLIEL